jgi:hypothetical protein
MAKMYEKFRNLDQYPYSNNVVHEPTVRLPHALHSPAVITHIPLFDKSQEDHNFQIQATNLAEFVGIAKELPNHVDPGLFSDISEVFFKNSRLTREFIAPRQLEETIEYIWQQARSALLRIAKEQPELLIFSSISLVSKEINRATHTTIIGLLKGTAPTTPQPWHDGQITKAIFELVNATLQIFLSFIPTIIDAFAKKYPSSALAEYTANRQEMLGGVISWFEGLDFEKKPGAPHQTTRTSRRIYQLGRPKPAPVIGESQEVIDEYLIWRRGAQNWRYTFYHGVYEYPAEEADDGIAAFLIKFLSSAALKDSFPSPRVLDHELDHTAALHYTLPGTRIGGAQYFVIPAELLLLTLARLPDLCSLAKLELTPLPQLQTANGRTADKCLEELISLSKRAFQEGGRVPAFEAASIKSPKELLHVLRDLRVWLHELMYRVQNKSQWADEFYHAFAGVSELCWKHIYDSVKQPYGHDDFICSRVIEGRALYFSNFRPLDLDDHGRDCGFTRTFFVDFGLTVYQRARLVRRLCEIATYRMSCMKDISRIRAMQVGLDELNMDFSLVVNRTAEDVSAAMRLALGLYEQMLEFDLFVSEGVVGRKLAAEADWSRIRKQVSDIREKRVTGYATLEDFLERGLAVAVADISRLGSRYDNLRNRVRDHLSRMRTELSQRQTDDIKGLIGVTGALLRDMRQLSIENGEVTAATKELLGQARNEITKSAGLLDDMKEVLNKSAQLAGTSEALLKVVIGESKKQTLLLRGADFLVLFGGTYYVRSLLDRILPLAGVRFDEGRLGVLGELSIIVSIFVALWIGRWLVGGILEPVGARIRRGAGRIRAGVRRTNK